MGELLESLDAIDSWVIVSHPSSCCETEFEFLMRNSKFPRCISLVMLSYSVYMDQPMWPWLYMQVRKYTSPSEKELKHIDRKLKSCWGHDE